MNKPIKCGLMKTVATTFDLKQHIQWLWQHSTSQPVAPTVGHRGTDDRFRRKDVRGTGGARTPMNSYDVLKCSQALLLGWQRTG